MVTSKLALNCTFSDFHRKQTLKRAKGHMFCFFFLFFFGFVCALKWVNCRCDVHWKIEDVGREEGME